MITTGRPALALCRTKRRPDITVSEEPKHHEHLGGVDVRVRPVYPFPRHRLAEEDDVRLERSAAAVTVREHELRPALHHGVAVRPQLGVLQPDGRRDVGVERGEAALHLDPRRLGPAGQADDGGDVTVQVDDRAAARRLVQAIDVLGDDAGQPARPLELGQRAMPGVRPGLADPPPALVGPGPVAAPSLRCPGELAELHRRGPDRRRPAVVRDAGVGGDPRAGQRDPGPAAEQVGHGRHLVGLRGHRHASEFT